MTKFFFPLLIACFLSILETSFFASFQGIFRFTPFVFALSVYLLQHHGITTATSWMIVHGLFLDTFHYGTTPFVTIAYTVAAGIAFLLAKNVFSNRSFYGIISCALLSYACFTVMVFFLSLFQNIKAKQSIFSTEILLEIWMRTFTLFLFLVLLFISAKHIRRVLIKLFLIPQSRQTF
ncbi:MAG: hypothetical protein AAB664_02925 [Patescibacteria group bacterium]